MKKWRNNGVSSVFSGRPCPSLILLLVFILIIYRLSPFRLALEKLATRLFFNLDYVFATWYGFHSRVHIRQSIHITTSIRCVTIIIFTATSDKVVLKIGVGICMVQRQVHLRFSRYSHGHKWHSMYSWKIGVDIGNGTEKRLQQDAEEHC